MRQNCARLLIVASNSSIIWEPPISAQNMATALGQHNECENELGATATHPQCAYIARTHAILVYESDRMIVCKYTFTVYPSRNSLPE